MPKLLTDDPDYEHHAATGRKLRYYAPHSPFQRLIDSQREKMQLSTRALAQKIKVSQSSLWIWLHNQKGYPGRAFDPVEHIPRLAKALKLTEEEIKFTLDCSRIEFGPKQEPTPAPMMDSFKEYIEVLERDGRKTVSLAWVINLAKRFHQGALYELEHADD